jgi:hypothetical protein
MYQWYTNIFVLLYLSIQPFYIHASIYKKCSANSHTVAVLVDSNRSCIYAPTSGGGCTSAIAILLSFTSQYNLHMQKFTRSSSCCCFIILCGWQEYMLHVHVSVVAVQYQVVDCIPILFSFTLSITTLFTCCPLPQCNLSKQKFANISSAQQINCSCCFCSILFGWQEWINKTSIMCACARSGCTTSDTPIVLSFTWLQSIFTYSFLQKVHYKNRHVSEVDPLVIHPYWCPLPLQYKLLHAEVYKNCITNYNKF